MGRRKGAKNTKVNMTQLKRSSKPIDRNKLRKTWKPTKAQLSYLSILLQYIEQDKQLTQQEHADLVGVSRNTVIYWTREPNFIKWLDKQLKEAIPKSHIKRIKNRFFDMSQGKTVTVTTRDGIKEVKQIDHRDQINAGTTLLRVAGELVDKREVKQTIDGEMKIAQLDVNELLKSGHLQSPIFDKEALIESDDEFSFEAFKEGLEIDDTKDKE